MHTIQHRTGGPRRFRPLVRAAVPAAAVVAVLTTGTAGPAAARLDPGEPLLPTLTTQGAPATDVPDEPHRCLLTRVGAEYCRCDDNTGNGVAAPGWMPEY